MSKYWCVNSVLLEGKCWTCLSIIGYKFVLIRLQVHTESNIVIQCLSTVKTLPVKSRQQPNHAPCYIWDAKWYQSAYHCISFLDIVGRKDARLVPKTACPPITILLGDLDDLTDLKIQVTRFRGSIWEHGNITVTISYNTEAQRSVTN